MTEYVYNIVLLAKRAEAKKNKLALRFTTLAIIAFAIGTNPSICPYGKDTYFDIAS